MKRPALVLLLLLPAPGVPGCGAPWVGDAAGMATALGLLLPAVVLFGLFFHARRKPADARAGAEPGPADGSDRPRGRSPLAQLCIDRFRQWLAECEADANLWSAFDLFQRQLFAELLAADRVRTFRVLPEREELLPLSPSDTAATETPLFARLGLLGHIVTTGKSFASSDPAQGELVRALAEQENQRWTCVWPARLGVRTLGLVALRCPAGTEIDAADRELLGSLVSLFWTLVDARERGQLAFARDRESGVLNRPELFVRAGRIAAAAAEEHEPAAVIALSIEGLRKLSDGSLWKQRHELIDGVGRVILARVRSDDCVGRLTDDCFVVLLRRVDSALAQLIARKLLQAVERELGGDAAGGVALGVRMGVAGSGLQPARFEDLLERANALLADGRAQQRPIVLDLPSPPERVA